MTDEREAWGNAIERTEYATEDEWRAEAIRRFGSDALQWRFVCPSCGHDASVRDWRDAGAPESTIAFSCVGRYMTSAPREAFRKDGGPCNYAGGGLFRINPVKIGGHEDRVFQFGASRPLVERIHDAMTTEIRP